MGSMTQVTRGSDPLPIDALMAEFGFNDRREFLREAFRQTHNGNEPNELFLAGNVMQSAYYFRREAVQKHMPWVMNYVAECCAVKNPPPRSETRIFRGPYLSRG